MIDIDEYARRAVASPIDEPPGMAAVTGLAVRQRRRRTLVRTASALALVGAVGLASLAFVSAGDRRSQVEIRDPRPDNSTSIPTPSTTSPASTPGTTPTTPSVSSLPRNLATNDSVKAALVVAFAAGQHIDVNYVSGTMPGSVYYAYDPGTHTYWALADFHASEAARRAHLRFAGTPRDPLIQFQDGPMVLSRTDTSAWRLVGDTGGLVCPPRPPAAVLASWGIGGGTNCK